MQKFTWAYKGLPVLCKGLEGVIKLHYKYHIWSTYRKIAASDTVTLFFAAIGTVLRFK